MSKALKSFFLSIIVFLTFSEFSSATHLIGGSMSYTFVSQTATTQTYKLRLVLYRDCQNSSTQFDDPIKIAIYNNDATKSLRQTEIFNLLTETSVNPPSGGSGCSFIPSVCIRQAVYEDQITLPLSASGYYVSWQRCCRTNNQINITDNNGQSYLTYIPGNSFHNNSPYFVGVPAPYICANDLAQVSNAATDPDGDSLVYSLVQPYAGGSATTPVPYDPMTTPGVPNTLTFPIPTVTYRGGFGATTPFGASGTANVNSQTGLCDFKAPAIGVYSVAIEVKEYRNGLYLGAVRRDVLLLVLNCPPNPPANLSGASGSGNTNPTITAGETTCFPVIFTDTQDSIYITSYGDILDGTGGYTGPQATLPDKSGFLTATTQFCWTPACNAARTNPYIITVQAQDNGCPAKVSSVNYYIKVNPFLGIDTIQGKSQICTPANGESYTVTPTTGSTYAWTVTGGTLVSGQGTASIVVNWPAATGSGSITVVETSSKNCVGINNTMNVTLEQKPSYKDITGDTIPCENTSGVTYSVPPTLGNAYNWNVTGGSIVAGAGTASITVNWGATGTGQISFTETSASGKCVGPQSVLTINIRPRPNLNAGNDQSTCTPGSVMQLNATGATIYQWNNDPTISATGINNPTANPTVTTDYVVSGLFSVGGCIAYDTVRIYVYQKPGPNPIIGDSIPCEFNTLGKGYGVTNNNPGSTFQWFVDGGSPSATTGNQIIVAWNGHRTVQLKVVEKNANGCNGDTNYLTVNIREVPVVDAGIDSVICEGDNIQLSATGANLYVWKASPALSGLTTPNPTASPITSTWYTVKGYLNAGGCESLPDSVFITVLNKPVLNIGEGDTICEGEKVEIKVLVGTNFTWNTGDTSRSIFVSPKTTTTYWVLVRNQKCIFDTLKATVSVNPKPVAGFDKSDTAGTEPLTVRFTNTSTGATGYTWTFGDPLGKPTNATDPSYTYEYPGKYTVKLVANNNFGCADSMIYSFIRVDAQKFDIFIPNVITPDGDGLNDFFKLIYVGYTSIKGSIYNRWGQRVYEWTGDNWWDGTIGNREVAGGEYVFFIECEGRHGRKDAFRGMLTVIR